MSRRKALTHVFEVTMMTNSLYLQSADEIVGYSLPLRALWYAAHGDWEQAHRLVQDDSSTACAWIHAYLHRVEGDLGNARYWYQRAGKNEPIDKSLDQELNELIAAFIE